MPNPRRLIALTGVAGRRLIGRLRRGDHARVSLSVLGVALAITFMVVVTGISVGLTTQTTVYGSNVDYWIVPESSASSTMAVAVGGPEFGVVHPTTERIRAIDGVRYATPVRAELVRLSHGNQSNYVLVLGIIPEPDHRVGGLPTNPLTPGDPHYANGTYEGPWTSDLVLSQAAASLLNASAGATLTTPQADQAHSFKVRNVSRGSVESGAGPLPVALVHLAELQTITGGADQDTADRFLVQTNTPGIAHQLESIYPQSRVVSQSGGSTSDITSSSLALAIASTAFVVALCVGALFVTTALGLELTADRAQYATMTAFGMSRRSQAVLVSTQTLLVTIVGGVLGILAGYAGIELTNSLTTRYVGTIVATPAPSIALYALGVTLVIGLASSPYLIWLTTRADPLTILD